MGFYLNKFLKKVKVKFSKKKMEIENASENAPTVTRLPKQMLGHQPVMQNVKEKPTSRAPFGEVKNGELKKSASVDKKLKPIKTEIKTERVAEVVPIFEDKDESKVSTKSLSKKLQRFKIFDPESVGLEDIDETTKRPFLCPEYAKDVYQTMLHREHQLRIQKDFLKGRSFSANNRNTVVDWLIQVHHWFQLLQETLYITVEIFDRYLAAVDVKRDQLQLAGVTAMHIASKYEEMFAPEISDYVYVSDDSITKDEVIQMELKMLSTLKCELGKPNCLNFLRRNSQAGKVEGIHHGMAKYLMELALVDYNLAHVFPSRIAASALFLSFKFLCAGERKWTATMEHYSTYTQEELMPVVRRICKLLVILPTNERYQFVRSKYAHKRLLSVSQHKVLEENKDYISNRANEYNEDDL